MKNKFLFSLPACSSLSIRAQQVTPGNNHLKAPASEWKGERFTDGRPKVPDKLLKLFQRLKAVRLEEAWGILRNKGYQHQFEREWMVLNPDY